MIMFVGHGLVAFAIAASVANYRDWPAERALLVGVIASLFATLPDVDMLYALLGVIGGTEGVVAASNAFWDAALVIHRNVTHSLVIGLFAAVGFALWRARPIRRYRAPALLSLAALPVVGFWAGGVLAGAILGAFVLGGMGIVAVANRWGFGPRIVLGTALVGLLSHPFGDLLTGAPPALLYPIEWTVVGGRVTLHPDPTLNLLGAFFVELATIWLALFVVARIQERHIVLRTSPRATLGVGYAAAVFAIPAPTLDVAFPFVASVLAVGLLALPIRVRSRPDGWFTIATTALTAVTVAALAYTSAYLIVF